MIKIRMLKPWFWRGGWLRKGETYDLANPHAEMLLEKGYAENVIESAMLESAKPRARHATKRKPKAKR